VVILYLHDFDPGGLSMPLAVARKIKFLLATRGLDLDIQLIPVVLNLEQCQRYNLPETPIKTGEKRKGHFKKLYGRDATELDALEANHPGVLRRLMLAEIRRYIDPNLDKRVAAMVADINGEIDTVNEQVRDEYAREIEALDGKYRALDKQRDKLWDKISTDLSENVPDISGITPPEARPAAEHPDPLYDSRRDYVEQIERYRRHQRKPANPILPPSGADFPDDNGDPDDEED
jgi:hypothetical protein